MIVRLVVILLAMLAMVDCAARSVQQPNGQLTKQLTTNGAFVAAAVLPASDERGWSAWREYVRPK